MSSVDSQVGKVGNTGILLSLGYWNGLSSICDLNLKWEVSLYRFLKGLSVLSLGVLCLLNGIPISGIPEGLINLPVTGDV